MTDTKHPSFTITSPEMINGVVARVVGMIKKGLPAGPVVITLGRVQRTLEQNAKFHPMIRDIKGQVNFLDLPLSEDDWKRLLLSLYKKQRVLPALDMEGVVQIGISSKKLSKEECSEFIESMYAYGSEHNVTWSKESQIALREVKSIEDYPEATNSTYIDNTDSLTSLK